MTINAIGTQPVSTVHQFPPVNGSHPHIVAGGEVVQPSQAVLDNRAFIAAVRGFGDALHASLSMVTAGATTTNNNGYVTGHENDNGHDNGNGYDNGNGNGDGYINGNGNGNGYVNGNGNGNGNGYVNGNGNGNGNGYVNGNGNGNGNGYVNNNRNSNGNDYVNGNRNRTAVAITETVNRFNELRETAREHAGANRNADALRRRMDNIYYNNLGALEDAGITRGEYGVLQINETELTAAVEYGEAEPILADPAGFGGQLSRLGNILVNDPANIAMHIDLAVL